MIDELMATKHWPSSIPDTEDSLLSRVTQTTKMMRYDSIVQVILLLILLKSSKKLIFSFFQGLITSPP